MTYKTQDAPMKIGDRIKFRAVTRWSRAAVSRVITGFRHDGMPLVRYNELPDFVVYWDEIIEDGED